MLVCFSYVKSNGKNPASCCMTDVVMWRVLCMTLRMLLHLTKLYNLERCVSLSRLRSSHPDLVWILPILFENPESRPIRDRDRKNSDFDICYDIFKTSLRQKCSSVYIILEKWKGFKRYLKATINFFISRYSHSIVSAWRKASCYFCVMFFFLETTQDCSLPVNSRKERRNKSSTGRVSSNTYTQQYCPVCSEEVKNCFLIVECLCC